MKRGAACEVASRFWLSGWDRTKGTEMLRTRVFGCAALLLICGALSAQMPELFYYKFNEGTGSTTANDAVPGAGNNPVTIPANAAWTSPGKFGASSLDCQQLTTNGIATGYTGGLSQTSSWTVEMWTRLYSTSVGHAFRFQTSSFRLSRQASGIITLLCTTPSMSIQLPSPALNTWVHYAFVYDHTVPQMTIYIDGVLESVTPTVCAGAGELAVGSFYTATTSANVWRGDMDEFRIWTHARTQAQIQANMNSEIGGQAPDMSVERNSAPISNSGADNLTDVSTLGQVFTYEIHNSGTDDLNLTGTPAVVVTPGAGAPGVSVISQPALTTIGFPGSTSFQVEVVPGVGAFDFQVSIDNDDALKNPYTFTVSGNGVITNFPAAASLPAGSAFSAIVAGEEYELALDPDEALANATITLDDPESDNIEITAVTPTGTAPTGIVPPNTGTVTSPHALTWTGTAEASNAPGSYTWLVDFEDIVNGTSVQIEVTLTINDLQPTHQLAGADGGDGTSSDPYTATYHQGDDQTATVDLATVSDENIGQTVTLSGFVVTASPGAGTGFGFSLAAGVLTIAPDGAALVREDMGTHGFEVTVSDGTNAVVIYVEVLVFGATGDITFDNASPLPSGRVDQPYSVALTVSGATAPVSFSVLSGALPAGLSMSAAGLITGTPTTPQTATFTVGVVDSRPDTASQQFELTVNPKPIGGGSSSGGSSGCSQGGSSLPVVFAVLALLAAGATRRRLRTARQTQ